MVFLTSSWSIKDDYKLINNSVISQAVSIKLIVSTILILSLVIIEVLFFTGHFKASILPGTDSVTLKYTVIKSQLTSGILMLIFPEIASFSLIFILAQ